VKTRAQQSAGLRSTQELADHLGLSRWTVSRALNGHSNVQPATARRVLQAARELGFAPNALARDLRRGRSNWIGVMLPGLAAYNLAEKIERLGGVLAERGYQTFFSIVSKDREASQEVLRRLLAMRVAGILTFAADWGQPGFPYGLLRRENTPVVHIDPLQVRYGLAVRTDREAAMCAIIHMLADRGHRRIAVVGVDPAGSYGRQRVAGFKKGCLGAGLRWGKEVRLEPLTEREDYVQEGAAYGEELAARREKPTAVVALNDRMALGLIRAFQQNGLRVPEDVSVVGYDNADFSASAAPPLTTVAPQTDALIDLAAGRLLDWKPGKRLREARIRPELVNRASVGFAAG
jgi:DNA-binding LacI/PurR family transcriptional regulator